MSRQQTQLPILPQRPDTNDPAAWCAYWQAQNQPWRTQPEINAKRQAFLTKRLTIKADIKEGIFPFKNFKLSRADIEWLLKKHEEEQASIDLNNEQQSAYKGLDLRAANLHGADLSRLPLTQMQGGLTEEEWFIANQRQLNMAAIDLENANLTGAQLQRASLSGAHLKGVNFSGADLEDADLFGADLRDAILHNAYLTKANLHHATLEGAKVNAVDLKEAKVSEELIRQVNANDEYRTRVPHIRQRKSPAQGALSGLANGSKSVLKWLANPFVLALITLIGTLIVGYQTSRSDLQKQNLQREIGIKTNLVDQINKPLTALLMELEFIEFNEESNSAQNPNAVQERLNNAFRDWRVSEVAVRSDISSYYASDQSCTSTGIKTFWSNFADSFIESFYYLTIASDKSYRSLYVQYIKEYFNIYHIDNDINGDQINWDKLIPYTVSPYSKNILWMDQINWFKLEDVVISQRDTLIQCIRNSSISLYQ